MPKEKNFDLTPLTILVDKNDLEYCKNCGINFSGFVRAKMKEYRDMTEKGKQPTTNKPIEIGSEVTKQLNEAVAKEIKLFVDDLKDKATYDNYIDGRLKLIKNRTGYDLTKTELKKLVENELKKPKDKQIALNSNKT